ncbi:DUF3857 domain-containing protein [Kaarinaea lacus]
MLAGFISSGIAAEFSKEAVPTWVEQIDVNSLAAATENQGGNGTLFLLADEQVNHTVPQSQRYYHYVEKVRNESGLKKASQITIDFDPAYQSLSLHNVNVIRGSKTINKLKSTNVTVLHRETDLENSVFDGRKTATLILDDVRVGDIVEHSYSVTGNNPAFHHQSFGGVDLQWAVPVANVFYKIIMPRDSPLNLKSYLTDNSFSKTLINGHWHYEYSYTSVPAIHRDEDIPRWYNPYPWIQISSFSQWQEVVKWALPFYQISKEAPENIQYTALNIGVDIKSPKARIAKALKFVQDDIRYTGIEMGISSYKPHSPDVVLDRRFGDCKDKVVLLISILQSLGLDAYPVLVHTRVGRTLETLLPSPTVFNHVIALVIVEGEQYWLDPTISAQYGSLDNIYQPDYGYGLVIREGENKLTRMTSVKEPPIEKEIFETFNVNFDDVPTELTVKTRYHGNSADNVRHYFNNNELVKIEKEYLNYFARYYPSIVSASSLRIEDNTKDNIFTVYELYHIPKFWELVEDDARFEAIFYQPDLNNVLKEPKYTKRTMPLATGAKQEVLVSTEVKLKERWPIKAENIKIGNNAFVFEKTVTPHGNDFTIDYRYQLLTEEVLPDSVGDYAKDIAQARDQVGYSIYTTELNGEKVGATANSAAFVLNWPIIFVFIMSLIISIAVCFKLYRYDPKSGPAKIDKDLVGIKGWLILPAIGLVLGPLRYLKDSANLLDYFNINQWHSLTLPSSEYYHHLWAPLIIGEIVATIFMFCFLVLVGILFFKKRSAVPLLYIIYILVSILVLFTDHFASMQIPFIAEQAKAGEFSRMISSSLGSLIWVAYFLKSRRVKSTFTVNYAADSYVQSVKEEKVQSSAS